MMKRRRVARYCTVCVIAGLLGACRDASAPTNYVRIDGLAPRLEAAPPARALLVAFWATWCAPCRAEAEQLRGLAASPPADLKVIVVSQDPDLATVEQFFQGPPDAALHLRLDPGQSLFNAFRIKALPAAVLVVGERLVARFNGPQEWDTKPMRALLERLTSQPSAPAEIS